MFWRSRDGADADALRNDYSRRVHSQLAYLPRRARGYCCSCTSASTCIFLETTTSRRSSTSFCGERLRAVQTMDLTVDASDKVGGTTTARCFCTSAMLEGTSPGARLTVPLLTVKRTDHAAAQQQARDMQRLDQLLERLDDGIADGYAKNKVTFSIHREAANDDFEWGQTMASCTPAETAEAQRIIVSFLRSHVFDVLAAMADDLASVHGRFYLFDPFIKSRQGDTVNPRWHQDGYSLVTQDDFFAHWYLPAAEPAAGTRGARQQARASPPTTGRRSRYRSAATRPSRRATAASRQHATAGTERRWRERRGRRRGRRRGARLRLERRLRRHAQGAHRAADLRAAIA